MQLYHQSRGGQATFFQTKPSSSQVAESKIWSSQVSSQVTGSKYFQVKSQVNLQVQTFGQVKSQVKLQGQIISSQASSQCAG